MTSPDPTQYFWWLASRASGIVALGLLTLSVGVGLTMASRLSRRPGLKKRLVWLHEHTAMVGLVAIALHGVTLLGDTWLRPGLAGIAIPFQMSYRPVFTGLGIVAGYVSAALALSFYARRRIGPRLWRKAHRFTVVGWAMAVVHTLGSGTDANTVWLRGAVIATATPICLLFLVRVFGSRRRPQTGSAASRPSVPTRRHESPVGQRRPATETA